ncbi:hypothetical protein ACJIZ3_017122 [Penstemon smallii]|uniref:Uncharacterized protein n=1 Tax=Penstemon smallii TaxID=265156 RepID=A0ABD3SUM9_9LAMI
MVSSQSLLMRLESLEAGRKGNLNIATEVFLVVWTQTVQEAISLPSHCFNVTFFVLEGAAVKFMLTMIRFYLCCYIFSFGNSIIRKPDVLIVCWYEISRIRHPIGVSKLQENIQFGYLYGGHDIFDEMWKADNDPLFEVLIQELGLTFGKVDPYFGVAARTACVVSRATVSFTNIVVTTKSTSFIVYLVILLLKESFFYPNKLYESNGFLLSGFCHANYMHVPEIIGNLVSLNMVKLFSNSLIFIDFETNLCDYEYVLHYHRRKCWIPSTSTVLLCRNLVSIINYLYVINKTCSHIC